MTILQTRSKIHDLIEQSATFDNDKAWYPSKIKDIEFTNTGVKLPPHAGLAVPPLDCTEHAWEQVYSKMGPAVFGRGSAKGLPRDYMKAIPGDLRAQNLNVIRNGMNGGEWLISQYQNTCRAVLGRDYPYKMGNTRQLEMAAEAFASHGEPSYFSTSVHPDRVWMKLLWSEVTTPDGPYGTGVFISGSEVGDGARKIYALLKRGVCNNSIIIGQGAEIAHTSRFEIMKGTLILGIAKALEAAGKALKYVDEAIATEIPSFGELAAQVAKDQGFSSEQVRLFIVGTEGRTNRMAFVNGLTYMAQHAALDESERYRLETAAGGILEGKDGLFTNAMNRVHALR